MDIHIIFKTHLDLGFTDFSDRIKDKYLNDYIPKAIDLAYELKDTDTPFIWTTGSWLIYEALKHDNGVLEKAIKDGLICWHALPFTTHTELMSEELMEYALSLSQQLDKRFNKKTTAAKMSDVPGHTKGLVHFLAKSGVKLLHIGVNPATPVPDVPEIFNWKCGEDSVITMYNGGGYGNFFRIGDIGVCFAHTADNCGPQDRKSIEEVYAQLRKEYPGAKLIASNLNNVAEYVWDFAAQLPVIDKEIGDSWIHGGGTDPKKMSLYRSLLRKIHQDGSVKYDLSDSLLPVPEHTWALDLKTFFHNDTDYMLEDFEKIQDSESCRNLEKSWEQQREYVYKAYDVMGEDLQKDAQVTMPSFDGYVQSEIEAPDFEISYQLFDDKDYERYARQYLQCSDEWAIWDFTKVGLSGYSGGTYTAKPVEMWKKGESRIYKLEFNGDIVRMCGLPCFFAEQSGGSYDFKWFGKKKNRLPEAFWVKFKNTGSENWLLKKLGVYIDPAESLGNPLLHGIWDRVKNEEFEIISYDAALAAPFGRNLLNYDLSLGKRDLYFNLYNNIWNTNFPMWFSDNARFRFDIKKINK